MCADDHIAHVNRVRKHGVLLQLLESRSRLAMIHNATSSQVYLDAPVKSCRELGFEPEARFGTGRVIVGDTRAGLISYLCFGS
jgi:hypothetical protein